MPRRVSKNVKAKLHALEQRYAYRRDRRGSPEGVFLEAKEGDKEMIARLGKFGSLLMEREPAAPGGLDAYAPWLAGILADIGRGMSPNEAFGWEAAGDRWKLHCGESWNRLSKAYQVAATVDRFASEIEGCSYKQALDLACKLWRADAEKCREVMTSVAESKERLGRGDAVELALDAVGGFGASGYVLSRATAADYYKEMIKSRRNV